MALTLTMAFYDIILLGLLITAVIVALMFLIVIGISVVKNRPFKYAWAEFVYEIVYNVLGSKSLLEDIIMKDKIRALELPSASGKVTLVTGGARGIGVEIVKKLAKCDAHIIIGCRNVAAGEELSKKIREEGIEGGGIKVFELDLNSLESVKSFAAKVKQQYPKIHILVNNAGKMFGPYMKSVDGFESQFAVNYLGHFLLTHLLLPELIAAGDVNDYARIVNVSSCAHTAGDINFKDINNRRLYIPSAAYAQSKLAQVLFTNRLNTLLREVDLPVSVYSVHPGIVDTDLFNGTHLKKLLGTWMLKRIFKTPAQGAASVLYACLSRKLKTASGTYISNCEIMPTCQMAYSTDLQEKMFDFTTDLLHIKAFGKE